MNRTIAELLFDGYKDTVMEIGNSLAGDDFDEYEEDFDSNDTHQDVSMDRFGWFYQAS